MYRLELSKSMQLKQYWCADLQVAEQIAAELKTRYGCDCNIVHDPDKQIWTTDKTAPKRFVLEPGLEFDCSEEQLDEALSHKGNVLKIKDEQEIFCFTPSDTFWQRQYDSSANVSDL